MQVRKFCVSSSTTPRCTTIQVSNNACLDSRLNWIGSALLFISGRRTIARRLRLTSISESERSKKHSVAKLMHCV